MGVDRRVFLGLCAAAPLLAMTSVSADARQDRRIARLIGETRAFPQVSRRMDAISRALLGTKYVANTLIGGPRQAEQFVVRDDAFDCVIFCEVVLAAALARNLDEFDTLLRRIRYRNGEVRWDERNHYFSDWSRRAVENGFCRPVAIPKTVAVAKTLNWENLGRRQVSLAGVTRATLLSSGPLLATGDIIGFVTRKPNLDFFHTGLVVVGPGGRLILRHASRSRGRVIDQSLAGFLTANGVQYVTLLRPADRRPADRRPAMAPV